MAFRHVRKRALGLVAVVLAVLAAVVAQPNPAAAIPNTGILPHEHVPGTITFPTSVVGKFLASALPDSISHQHRQPINLGENRIEGGRQNPQRGRPALYDAYAVWDDRTRLVDDDGTFDRGHGYIDDRGYGFPTTIAGFRVSPFSAVRYCISTEFADLPRGTPAQRAEFHKQVRESFTAYSRLDAPEAGLVTGLEFVEVDCAAAHEVVVRWRNIGDLGLTSGRSPVTVTFDDLPVDTPAALAALGGWSLNAAAAVPDDEFHFRSTALHEIGHVVGLDHDDNLAEVMYFDGRTGCRQHLPVPAGADTRGPCYDGLEAQDVAGSLDLYSVPAPDFGDAPDPYPTKLTQRLVLDKGARAPGITQEWMGPGGASTTTRERTPNQTAGDAGDDGCIARDGKLSRRGDAQSKIDITVSFASASRYSGANLLRVAVWVDFNDDKDWTSGEQVVLDSLDPANPGGWARVGQASSFRKSFDVDPPWDSASRTWMRCRLAYASGTAHLSSNAGDESLLPAAETPAYLLPGTGEDSGGEIEDHLIDVEEIDYCTSDPDDESCQDDDGDGEPDPDPDPDPDSDSDGDDWPDSLDNCPDDASEDRSDLDDDGAGDVCDTDDDGDGIDEGDGDEGDGDEGDGDEGDGDEGDGDEGDEEGDVDVCPMAVDPDQADLDDDGAGDVCDTDDDGDGADDDDEIETGSDPEDPDSGPEADDVGGTCGDGLDNDGDGLDDTEDGGCPDRDDDGTADIDDDDDDGDGTPDVEEDRGEETDPDEPGDSDDGDDPDDPGDSDDPDDPDDDIEGIGDIDDLDGVEHVLVGDTCGDGIDNDADDLVDGDDEGCMDEDGDGVPDVLDEDDDGDGVPDVTDPDDPVDPDDPIDPVDPGDPEGPLDQADPDEPLEPVGTVHPVDPLRPVDGDFVALRSALTHQLD